MKKTAIQSRAKKADDPKRSRTFVEKAREIGADEDSSRADELLGRPAKMPPKKKRQMIVFGNVSDRRHWAQIASLRNRRREISDEYAALRSRAKQDKTPRDDIEQLYHSETIDTDEIDDDIEHLETTYWLDQARSLSVPIAEHDKQGCWKQSSIDGTRRLSPDYRAELMSAVRRERRERREPWQIGFTLFIGLIGALIGLASVLKK